MQDRFDSLVGREAFAWLGSLVLAWLIAMPLGCSKADQEGAAAPDDASGGARDEILSPTNIARHETDWPNIVALVEDWTPAEGEAPLEAGYRGALMRVEDDGRVRIAFGRHGNHDVPIERTDLVLRANQIRRGELHKVAPGFLAHFGGQFIEVVGTDVAPVQTPRIAPARRFLLLFADPRAPGFEAEATALIPLQAAHPELQILYFPLGLAQEEIIVVRDVLSRSGLLVPFAYPAAADLHARAILGHVPTEAHALLITPEGRILERGPIRAEDWVARLTAGG